jgi:hypothetical protein
MIALVRNVYHMVFNARGCFGKVAGENISKIMQPLYGICHDILQVLLKVFQFKKKNCTRNTFLPFSEGLQMGRL